MSTTEQGVLAQFEENYFVGLRPDNEIIIQNYLTGTNIQFANPNSNSRRCAGIPDTSLLTVDTDGLV